MRHILLLFAIAALGSTIAAKASYLCSWIQEFELSDSKTIPCGNSYVLAPTTETITINFQCWKLTPHNPSSCQTIYTQTNMAMTGGGGCGAWVGGDIPGQGGSCNPQFSWGTSDIGGSGGVTAHLAQMEVQSYNLYALPGFPVAPPVCLTGTYQQKTWRCQAQYCS